MSEPAIAGRLTEFRDALAQLKRDTAKVVAAMQLGGDRRKRRELARSLEACKRRGRAVSRYVDALLPEESLSADERAELEQAASFLAQLQEFTGT
jgi:hypothetical protein